LIAAMRAGYDELAALDLNTLTHPEILCALGELESLTRRLPSLSHRLLSRLQREAAPKELGAKSWQAVLSERLRIGGVEAHRRLGEATELGPRVALTGSRWRRCWPRSPPPRPTVSWGAST